MFGIWNLKNPRIRGDHFFLEHGFKKLEQSEKLYSILKFYKSVLLKKNAQGLVPMPGDYNSWLKADNF